METRARSFPAVCLAVGLFIWLFAACTDENDFSPARTTPAETESPLTATVPLATVTATGVAPQVLLFTVSPSTTEAVGDVVALAWDAEGDTAEVCPIEGQPVTSACVSTPLSGTMLMTTTEAMLTYDSLGLRVTAGEQFTWATVAVAFQCENLRAWFFTPPPDRCPAADAVVSAATRQPFEHGFMIWFKESDTYYVFYDTGGPDYPSPIVQIATGPLDSMSTVTTTVEATGTPPAGTMAPAGDFGRLWRGEIAGIDGAAGGLGWATGPIADFQSAYQCEMSGVMHGWTCYLQGPNDEVLRMWPDSTAQVHTLWAQVQ